MEEKLREKQKHIEYLYNELDAKDREYDKLKDALEKSKLLYKKQTEFAQEVLDDKDNLSLQLKSQGKEIARLSSLECEKHVCF